MLNNPSGQRRKFQLTGTSLAHKLAIRLDRKFTDNSNLQRNTALCVAVTWVPL
jgi:hypothetical protein